MQNVKMDFKQGVSVISNIIESGLSRGMFKTSNEFKTADLARTKINELLSAFQMQEKELQDLKIQIEKLRDGKKIVDIKQSPDVIEGIVMDESKG